MKQGTKRSLTQQRTTGGIKMVNFRQSYVDGAWICEDCGGAIYPTPNNINEHLNTCNQ